MAFKPFTIEDFNLLDGGRIGANNAQTMLMLLVYAVNRWLQERNVKCPSVVANPVITRHRDARRAGWCGWIPGFQGIPDPTLNPLSNLPSISVFVFGKDNFKGETAGLQVVTEFGEGKRLTSERENLFRYVLNSEFTNFAFLGRDMALELRGKPDTRTCLQSPDSLAAFQRIAAKEFDPKDGYAVFGRFFSPEEACALSESTVETVGETVRRLLLLVSNAKAG